jgi:integrase/recombinase XerD
MNECSKELVKRYLEFHVSKSFDTLRYYKSALETFMEYFPDKSWDNITVDDALYFYNNYRFSRDGRLVSERTRIRRLRDVSRFYDWAVKYNYLLSNPIKLYVESLRIPKQEEAQALSEEQVNLLLSKITNYEYYVFTLFLLCTGVRIRELSNLTLKDCDFKDRTIFIREGKGMKDRYVFMNDELYYHMRGYIDKIRTYRNPKTDNFFVSLTGRAIKEYYIDKYRCYLNNLSEDMGFEVRPHKLRHTFGTMACQKGMNVEILAKIMGHSDMRTTLKYLHSSKEVRKNEYLRVMNNDFLQKD